MRLLAIETSCDETAVCILDAEASGRATLFRVLGNELLSQIELHREYGGVFPSLAKREHAKNLVPLFEAALQKAGMLHEESSGLSAETRGALERLLEREPELFTELASFLEKYRRPKLDAVTVTNGPGLEPALWVGINFAKALAHVWKLEIIPVNHMAGHLFSALLEEQRALQATSYKLQAPAFPVLALLISGGHTELVTMDDISTYRVIGKTRDDAVGEAFDKVARILGLPYPGGPEISRLADEARQENLELNDPLPRPMLDSDNFDFSFSGLKTAVLYRVRDTVLTPQEKKKMARAFEDAAADVLMEKTLRAFEETNAKTLIVGGGVSANNHLRTLLSERMQSEHSDAAFSLPDKTLTTDNAIMIGVAGFYQGLSSSTQKKDVHDIRADGNLSL